MRGGGDSASWRLLKVGTFPSGVNNQCSKVKISGSSDLVFRYLLVKELRLMCLFSRRSGRNVTEKFGVCGCSAQILPDPTNKTAVLPKRNRRHLGRLREYRL